MAPPADSTAVRRVAAGMIETARSGLARTILEKVAGPDPDRERALVHDAPGERWFAADRPIRRVHGDAAMFVGGLRALLLQSLHPLAMAAVAAVDHVRSVHERIRGRAPDGTPYVASDPHPLAWVHLAEVDSFLAAHQRYGADPLDARGMDAYVADTARIAAALGVLDPPTTVADLRAGLAAYRPELRGTPQARAAARFILFRSPVPLFARPAYGVLTTAAVGLLPWWTRWPLRLPYLPIAEATVVRASGELLTRTIRWALSES